MGFAEYDPEEIEIKRYIMELRDFHERVTNLQYFPSEEEIDFMIRHLPVQISGDASEKIEVSNYKDLDRFASNYLSNGICLVIGEGLTQKGGKFWKRFSNWHKDFEMKDWKWMSDFVDLQKKIRSKGEKSSSGEILPDYNYLKDIVAGRPVLAYPMRKGGLRLRYGRSRISGLSSTSLHPATMIVLDSYIANGTQLKMERPGKSSTLSVCDSIEGPIVKLKNGSVIFIDDVDDARNFSKDVEEILFLGDILINYGDFFNRGHKLVKPGYCEEWWLLELEDKIKGKGLVELSNELEIEKDVFKKLFKGDLKLNGDDAVKLSVKLGIFLHPRYTYHWNDITFEDFSKLIEWLSKKMIVKRDNNKIEKIILPFEKENLIDDPKRTLELIGLPHVVVDKEYIIIEEDDAVGLAASLGFLDDEEKLKLLKLDETENILDIINKISLVRLRDKSGFYIGARMGRPEKGKMRKLIGSPHCLFPVGEQGGKMRSLQSALEKGYIKAEFSSYFCERCNEKRIYPICEKCSSENKRAMYCEGCKKHYFEDRCEKHGELKDYSIEKLNIHEHFRSILNGLKLRNYPDLIKGVRGTSNSGHVPENLAKGILRAAEDVYVNRDGTTRYDMTEMCITHFKPKEIGVGIEQLKIFGYLNDVNGNELKNEDQLIEIMPQDVILPSCEDCFDEGADEVLFRVSKFVDDLLERFYGMERFYRLKDKRQLIGHLVLAMSPHTSAGVVCRIIGFSKLQGFLAHPLLHSIMRRDCLGYDNYVAIEKDGKWKIDKIGDYVEDLKPDKAVDIYGTMKKDLVGVNTWSNPGSENVKEATKHPPANMLKFSLEDGRTVEVTDGHRFYLRGKKQKRASEIKEGEQLMVTYRRDIKEFDIKEIFLPDFFCDRDDVMLRNVRIYLSEFVNLSKHDNFTLRDSFPIKHVKRILESNGKTLRDLPDNARMGIKRDNISIPLRVNLDDCLLKVVGMYIAEGYLRGRTSEKGQKGLFQISISSCDKLIRDLIRKTFQKHFGLKPTYSDERQVTFSSRIVYEFFKDVLNVGEKASNKRIPSLFLNLKKRKIVHLLRGYFEGDGSVSLSDIRVTCDTISVGLKHDLSFVLSRFGIFTKFYEYEKEPEPQVREFYIKKNRKIPKFRITKLIIPSNFVKCFTEIGFLSDRKNGILKKINERNPYGMKIDFDENYVYPKITKIENLDEKESYCFNVSEEHNFFTNDILVHNCDGDEACVVLLMDALLNFSRKLLPGHRGARQDAPLVLTTKLIPAEVDDMVFDIDVGWRYPLEFYEAAEKFKDPWDVGIPQLNKRLGSEKQYEDYGFTHSVSDINMGVLCSNYKKLPTMKEKVFGQMNLAEKIRAVDEDDVARLVIERHFMRDIRGNLRKFSQQQFRCVDCNMKFRRVPLAGVCSKCKGRIIFTVAEGSIVKYMGPAMSLIERYDLPVYLRQTLELTKNMIESVFLQEKEKQMGLGKWF